MAFCSSCGANIADGATFCPQCGKGQGAAPAGGAPAAAGTGLAENVAGGLSYVLGWLTGIIFLLIDKRPFVRFHAAQSIVVFGALHVVQIVLGYVFGFGFLFGGGASLGSWAIAGLISTVVGLVCLVLWILLMVKAFQGEKFRVPVAADFAEKLAGK
ncbi:MAG: zinc-ribbon domain-containing protein [Acidobacteria bacterium]|nr:zinc-ribbon domain-containing protein [Acidobacteriota bacterium]